MMATTLTRIGMKLPSGGLVPLLLVLGLVMAPVTCACGAAVPHGHSLFQLPHHNHAAANHADDHHPDEAHHSPITTHQLQMHPLSIAASHPAGECDEMGRLPVLIARENVAFSNALEHQDGWVIKTPPGSSFGQPTVMTQPSSMISIAARPCGSIDLPAARTLEGLETTPETPPPRA